MSALLHKKFKINGVGYTQNELLELAKQWLIGNAAFLKTTGSFLLNWFDDSEIIPLQTSGSTGVPKKINVKKMAMVHSAKATGAFFDLMPENTVLNCLPVEFVSGKMMIVRALVLGLNIELVEASGRPLENNPKKYDFVAMTPLQASQSILQLKNIKILIIGGAKINVDLEEQLLKVPSKIYETYGMTETVSHIAMRKISEKAFTVLPNVLIMQDIRKCLIIEAPHLLDAPLITNDLVEMEAPNQFTILGRYDSIINSGGIKLIPEVIENKLVNYINERFFIVGTPDAVLGQKVVLVIESVTKNVDWAIFDILDKYEKPKEIIFLEKFKETGNGKIIRKL
jgi:o-succinylbenzoate---CoA ligase